MRNLQGPKPKARCAGDSLSRHRGISGPGRAVPQGLTRAPVKSVPRVLMIAARQISLVSSTNLGVDKAGPRRS